MRLTIREKFNIIYFIALTVLILINIFLDSFYLVNYISAFIIICLLGFKLFTIIREDKKEFKEFFYSLGFGIFVIGMIFSKKIFMLVGISLIILYLIYEFIGDSDVRS